VVFEFKRENKKSDDLRIKSGLMPCENPALSSERPQHFFFKPILKCDSIVIWGFGTLMAWQDPAYWVGQRRLDR
jgi:hypothetical protein